MPLFKVYKVAEDVALGLWKVEESVDVFFSMYAGLQRARALVDSFGSPQRRLEVLAVRSLIGCMLGWDVDLRHDENGKPYLSNGVNIGISHTRGCAAVIVSRSRSVAVDVEYESSRVEKVASRMLRSDEKAVTLREKILHWCAKETVYKLYSEDALALSEMQVISIAGHAGNGVMTVRNVRRDESLAVHYGCVDGFVVTFAAL